MTPHSQRTGTLAGAFLKGVGVLEGTPCAIQAVITSVPRSVKFVFASEGGVPSKLQPGMASDPLSLLKTS